MSRFNHFPIIKKFNHFPNRNNIVVPFNPNAYPIIAWWDFNGQFVTKDSLNRISIVADRSPNGYNQVQANDSFKPTHTIVNGIGVARFDNVNDMMVSSFGTTYNQPLTYFAIWKTFASGNYFLFDGIDATHRNIFYTYTAPSAQVGIFGNLSALGYDKTLPLSSYILTTGVFNGATSKIYENGVLMNTGSIGTNSCSGITLGSRYSGVGTLNGDNAEMIIVNGLMSDEDRVLFERYLMQKVIILNS